MLNFTSEEKQVILFLLILGLSGSGINFLAKRWASVRTIVCVNPDLGKVNLNTADKQTLKLIPGVGDKLAQRILDYRQENKKFFGLEDLGRIKGFHKRTLEKARGQIIIE